MLFIWVSVAGPGVAVGAAETIDISGTYTTTHPREEWGEVFVRFEPTQEEIVYDGVAHPSNAVSLWKQGDDGIGKLRDGLFGTFTFAAVRADDRGWVLLWYSPDEKRFAFNRVVRVDFKGDLRIGSPDPLSDDSRALRVLTRVEDGTVPHELVTAELNLEGVYRYFHGATGLVYVRLEKTGTTMEVARGVEVDACAVTVVSRVGDPGYCPVREGLYGGSFRDDSFPLVGLHSADDGDWLVWTNPASPGRVRRNRIVSRYPDGSIGIGLDEGERKYVEDTVFQKVAGPNAVIGEHADLLELEGEYSVRVGESETWIRTWIFATDVPDGMMTGSMPGETAVYTIVSLHDSGGTAAAPEDRYGAGLYDGDPFTHVSIITREGNGYFVWHSRAHDVTEENLIFDLDADGNFLLVGGEFGRRYVVAEFRKVARSESDDACAQAAPPTAPGDAGAEERDATRLQRAFIRNAARRYYEELGPEHKEEWRSFALWPRGLVAPSAARNTNPAGYAGGAGMESPELDFATFAVDFFMPVPYKDPMHHARHRLPDRYAFFCELFGTPPDLPETDVHVRDLREWIDPAEVEHIEIIVTTPTATAPESLAGHLLLLIRRRGDHHDGSDSLVVGFVGVTSLDSNNDVGSIVYAWRGITGHYPSAVQEETFSDLIQRATVLENRDVQRFRLNLSAEETTRLIRRLWVIRNTFTYQYRFFGVNCATMLLDALNHAFPVDERINLALPLVPPLYIVAALEERGRLSGPVYPEYWSIGKAARDASVRNSAIESEILGILRHGVRQSGSLPAEDALAAISEQAHGLFALLRTTETAEVRTDPLFREPVAGATDTERAAAYDRLARLFAELGGDHVGEDSPLTTSEYTHLAELLLRYFMNAFKRELYMAVPADIKSGYAESDPVAAAISPEQVQEQLRSIQLRQRDSREIRSLRRALSIFRLSLESTHPDPSMYTIGRLMQAEFNAELAAARAAVARTHGYYPVDLSLGVRTWERSVTFTMGLDAAFFTGDLGHSSIFALKQDMRMVLLSAGLRARAGIDGGLLSRGQGLNSLGLQGTVFDFQKVLPGNDVDYTGRFNHGFGFTVLDARMELSDTAQPLADAEVRLRALEARYVLNIFEAGGFRHFLNVAAGSSYWYERTGGAGAHLFGLPLEVEGKVHTGGSLENCVRAGARYEPLLSARGVLSHMLSASTRFVWSPPGRPHTTLCVGAEVSLRLPAPIDVTFPLPDLYCYVRLR